MNREKLAGVSMMCLQAVLLCATGCSSHSVARLPKEDYTDKCLGAWVGQMVGVAYGAPYEFEYNGRMQEDPIRPWRPEFIANALSQDDLYVEMTWLSAIESYGLGIAPGQAGKAFADTTCGLAHANNLGRENIRHGIQPPLSGHPQHNRHADDIDFQIESDLFGILCPGLPQESNRLCDVFGHLMNYGDGVYGGMFIAGMYSAAYFESRDVDKVIRAGLACIPPESLYHKCISDVIRWHCETPDDWRSTWHKIEKKWQDDVDCVPGSPFNIDARLNGAYVVLGLLYGNGDFDRTLEIAVRCGQDNDCNPSNAAGVLGCMKGCRAIPEKYTAGLPGIQKTTFADGNRNLAQTVEACRAITEKIILRCAGRITEEAYLIPIQRPKPARLEQWENQMALLSVAIPRTEVERWDPRFTILSCGYELGPGHIPDFAGRTNIMLLVPKHDGPAVMEGGMDVPDRDRPTLRIPVSSFGTDGHWIGDFRLKVLVNGQPRVDRVVRSLGRFELETVDLSESRGQTVKVRLEVHQEGKYHWERAYFGRLEID